MAGGAAIAGQRLIKALRGYPVEINNVVLKADNRSGNQVTPVANSPLLEKVAWAKLALEKGLFYFHEKTPEIRFQFSTNAFGFNLAARDELKNTDIVHIHWPHQGFLSLKQWRKIIDLGKPIVWTMHDMWAFTGGCHYTSGCNRYFNGCGNCPYLKNPAPNDLSKTIYRQKEKLYHQATIHLVTCSQWLAANVKESPLLGNQPVYHIPNPIDTEKFKPGNKIKARQFLGLPENRKLVLFGAAKLNDKRKGFKYLVHALKMLKYQYPELEKEVALLIFGSHDETYKKMLPFDTYALGSITNPEMAFQAADVFVLPSLQDNLPNTIMEAMATGLPCIGYNTGGIPEMVEHKVNGYVAQYKSDEDIMKGLNYIIREADYSLLSENARKKVTHHFNEQKVAEQYLELYKTILQHG